MKNISFGIILVFIFLIGNKLAFAESYLCIEEQSVGFKYKIEKDIWESANFNPDDKYIIKNIAELENKPSPKWLVYGFNKEYPDFACPQDFNDLGYLICDSFCINRESLGLKAITPQDFICAGEENIGNFKFNRQTMRFLRTYSTGYYNSEKEFVNDTPIIAIGTCSKISE